MNQNKVKNDTAVINKPFFTQKNYDEAFLKDVYTNSKEISYEDYLKRNETIKDNKLRIIYSSKDDFIKYAKYFGIMNDFKVSCFQK